MSGLADTSLKEVAARLRGAVIDMSHVAGTPHLGSSPRPSSPRAPARLAGLGAES